MKSQAIFYGVSKLFEKFGKGGDTGIFDPGAQKLVGFGVDGSIESLKRNCLPGAKYGEYMVLPSSRREPLFTPSREVPSREVPSREVPSWTEDLA